MIRIYDGGPIILRPSIWPAQIHFRLRPLERTATRVSLAFLRFTGYAGRYRDKDTNISEEPWQ